MSSRIASPLTCAVLVLTACRGEGSAPPWPQPAETPPRVASITEWSTSEPEFVQRGEFTYDASGRLTRYDFGHNVGGPHRVTLFVLYFYDGSRISRTETHVRDGDAFRHVRERAFTYDASGRLERTTSEEVDERTGDIVAHTEMYQYDGRGQLAMIVVPGGERRRFTYDDAGNVATEELLVTEGVELVTRYEYERSLNPLAGLPPAFDGVILVFGKRPGPYNIASWTTGTRGLPIASSGTATHDLDGDGYPVRREMTAVNTADPSSPTTIITEFAYVP
jgi:YD repeat-containing protein